MKRAITRFWDLKLKPTIDWATTRTEEAEAQQLFENHFFCLSPNSKVRDFWIGAGFENLKHILSESRSILTKSEIATKLGLTCRNLTADRIKYRAHQLSVLIKNIPPEAIAAITKPIEAIKGGELICWQAYDAIPHTNETGWRYGQTLKHNHETLAIQELYVDTSGVPSPVGDPHLPVHDSYPAS